MLKEEENEEKIEEEGVTNISLDSQNLVRCYG